MKDMFVLLHGSNRLFFCVSCNDQMSSLRDCHSSEYTRVDPTDVSHVSYQYGDIRKILEDRL